MDEQLHNTLATTTPFNEAKDLYETAKAFWLFGDWRRLTDLAPEQYDTHPEKAKISLFIGSAHLQLNNMSQAEHHIKCAYQWQIDHKAAARILIAGVNNTLGRIASLNEDTAAAQIYFEKSLDVGINNADLVAHSRAVKEMASLGLLPQAAQMINTELFRCENHASQIKDPQAQLKILQIGLELLNSELNLSQQKQQLYSIDTEHKIEPLTVGSPDYIENLKKFSPSQLGQDLWVLEKTDFKRNGYFVEFGATDGVLLSNTYLLEKQFGWTGICAEPNPKFFEKLKNSRNCTVTDSCIAGESDNTVEFIFADEYGGISLYAGDDKHADKRMTFSSVGEKALLKTISLDDFLIKYSAPKEIDYLSIDTEGSEFEILSNFKFDNWDIKLITVEHNFTSRREDIYKLLTDHGYKRLEQKFDDWYYK